MNGCYANGCGPSSLQESVCQKEDSGNITVSHRRRSPSEDQPALARFKPVVCVCVCVTWPEPKDLLHLPERRVFLWQEQRGAVGSEPGSRDQSEDPGRRGLQVAGVSRVGTQTPARLP